MRPTTSISLLYVSTNPSNSEFQRIRESIRPGAEEVTYGMPEASHKFHNSIAHGFAGNHCQVSAISPRPISHRFHRGWFWKSSREIVSPNHEVYHPWTINLPAIKQLVHVLQLVVYIIGWLKRTRGDNKRIIFIDAAYVTGYPFVIATSRFSRVKVISSFADVYSYMADVQDASMRQARTAEKIARKVMRSCIDATDGYMVITEAINNLINKTGKPFVVIEGLASPEAETFVEGDTCKYEKPTVLYAGALRKEYGLDDLVRGFSNYNNPDASLIIYGSGDYADQISSYAKADQRIDFRGRAPLAEILLEERRAWLLINPRPTTHEFTRYSFPSKNIEYMQSGTALLTTKLPGMPTEYYDFIYAIEGTGGAEEITNGLSRCLQLGLDALVSAGQSGREFILRQKSAEHQASKILELFE